MLLRALLAFLALPGVVAFVVPLLIGPRTPHGGFHPLGVAVLGVGLLIVAGYAFGLLAAFHLRVVLSEEPFLARTHGTTWEAYAASVPRWFGRWHSSTLDSSAG